MAWTTTQVLTGATIEHAEWQKDWLILTIQGRGEMWLSPKRIGLEFHCPRCLEHRLVEIVTDARGKQGFCSVCAFYWWLTDAKEG